MVGQIQSSVAHNTNIMDGKLIKMSYEVMEKEDSSLAKEFSEVMKEIQEKAPVLFRNVGKTIKVMGMKPDDFLAKHEECESQWKSEAKSLLIYF